MAAGRNKGKRLNQYTKDYIVFDLETTGIRPMLDEIIEISALKVKNRRIVEEFSTLVRPSICIPKAATAVNGITDKMVCHAPDLKTAMKEFMKFIGQEILVGHNIHSFDMNFIYDAAMECFQEEIHNDYIDTLYLARECLPNLKHHKLSDISQYFEIDTTGAHRALNDCIMNQKCYEKMAAISLVHPNLKKEVMKKYFGYDNFRGGQEVLIDTILQGTDVLGIMPTGAGKSLCYQIPALMLPGITLVISPLISLMKDQVRALNQAGIHAAYINSSLTENQIATALRRAKEGAYKIIYVAPERLQTATFLDVIRAVKISMVTVDEAHCISQWGQDFRPSYLNIIELIKNLPVRPVVSGFTATATEEVKEDIICVLGLKNPKVEVTGFDRPNLYFEVKENTNKDQEVRSYVEEHIQESGIIYCATRKNVEKVYEMLNSYGVPCTHYHAGLSNEMRKENQDAFIFDEKPVMIATNAFGMGIDKSNVRYVIHYNMPQSLENYYQEAGRAGRDGEKSDCILLYSPQDVMINQYLLEGKGLGTELEREEVEDIRQRDMQRLRQMTYYCITKNCLREYILNYFGEKVNYHCGNCSNCKQEFEEIEVGSICMDIIRCIQETHQRYGVSVIVGVLRGEKKEKLIANGLNQVSTYGIQRETSEIRLKQIIHEMMFREILMTSNDKYAVLKLGSKAQEIVNGSASMLFKISKMQESSSSTWNSKVSKSVKRSDILTSAGFDLFEALREKRKNIAKEENMPPYIIFSDKTLVDMCVKNPKNKKDMLEVNGVGEHKFEKYGEQFLAIIQTFMEGKEIKLCWENTANETEERRPEIKSERKSRNKKADFQMTKEIVKQLDYLPECTIAELARRISEFRDESTTKRITGVSINEKLEEKGYFKKEYVEGRWQIQILQKGKKLGIFMKTKISEKGNEYEVLYYTEQAQREIIRLLME